ncbi:MAG: hypothetical protein LAT82_04275 [Nanoarchaeota archaeon]|nr:hypothetical protein [Nanoarchaeota archaeon]
MNNLNAKIQIEKIFREHNVKICLNPWNQKCNRISKAHSIQNNKILSKISDNGKVLTFDLREHLLNNNYKLSEKGRKVATTFTGLCNTHDSKLFSPIENYNFREYDLEHNFLYAYRALLKEFHAKISTYEIYKYLVSEFPELSNLYKSYINGTKKAINEMSKFKREFDNFYLTNKFDEIITFYLNLDSEYLIACSTTFYLVNDLRNSLLNDIYNPNSKLRPFFLSIFPQNDKTNILISYFKKDKELFSRFFKDFNNLSLKKKKEKISLLLSMYCENFIINPSYWETQFSFDEKKKIIDIFCNSLSNIENYNIKNNIKINFFK